MGVSRCSSDRRGLQAARSSTGSTSLVTRPPSTLPTSQSAPEPSPRPPRWSYPADRAPGAARGIPARLLTRIACERCLRSVSAPCVDLADPTTRHCGARWGASVVLAGTGRVKWVAVLPPYGAWHGIDQGTRLIYGNEVSGVGGVEVGRSWSRRTSTPLGASMPTMSCGEGDGEDSGA
jgi:hypothetical protein